MADAESQRISDAMNAYWAQFARSGVPNFADAPAPWPAFVPSASDDDKRIQFDPALGVLDNFRKEECSFWRSLVRS
jgi:carboxylesterase type B